MDNFYGIEVDKSLTQSLKSYDKLLKGINNIMNVDYSGFNETPKDLIFEEDKMKLYHYRPLVENINKTPLLIVYALVNKQYMMDLQEDKSIIRNLLKGGQDLYIIDWGYPTADDRYIGLDDYINGYINDCVDLIRKRHKLNKINLMGICQGGTFSYIYTALNQNKIKNLVSLVTPVDFSTNDGLLFKWGKYLDPEVLVDTFGNIPGEFMNAGFVFLKPLDLMIDKYVGLIDYIDDEEKLANFLRMEQWIFDSPDQVGRAYKEFQIEMYHKNSLIKGEFSLDGKKKVDLKNIKCPFLAILGLKDNQVPPAATRPIMDAVSSEDKELLEVNTGHIGLFVSSKSQKEVAPKINNFLNEHK